VSIGRTTLTVELEPPPPPDDTELVEDNAGDSSFTVSRAVDATRPFVARARGDSAIAARRLELLYELPLHFAAQEKMEGLGDVIARRLVEVIRGAGGGALLLLDPKSGKLLLKGSHYSGSVPPVSERLAHRAMDEGKGFIWKRTEEETAETVTLRHIVGMYAPLIWNNKPLGVVCVSNSQPGASFAEDDLELIAAVARYASMAVAGKQMQEDLKRMSMVRANLIRQFGERIAQRLMDSRRPRLEGRRSEVTILCSDIRNFTQLTSEMEPDDVVDLLNDYFEKLTPIVFHHAGTIDKYVGDAILAVFGSPDPDDEQHAKGVRAALEMQDALRELNKTRAAQKRVVCEMGIGVHCGNVLHGFIGTEGRMDFTVIGDAVNLATRYCAGAGPGEVLVSKALQERLWNMIQSERRTFTDKHGTTFEGYRVLSLGRADQRQAPRGS
jgi:adenylate cyclase